MTSYRCVLCVWLKADLIVDDSKQLEIKIYRCASYIERDTIYSPAFSMARIIVILSTNQCPGFDIVV